MKFYSQQLLWKKAEKSQKQFWFSDLFSDLKLKNKKNDVKVENDGSMKFDLFWWGKNDD